MPSRLAVAFSESRDKWGPMKDNKSYYLNVNTDKLYVWDHSKLIMQEFEPEVGSCEMVFDILDGNPPRDNIPPLPVNVEFTQIPELVVFALSREGEESILFTFTEGTYILGKETAGIAESATVAPLHCEFTVLKGSFYVRDCGSSFGTFIGDKELNGEWFVLGKEGLLNLGQECKLRYKVRPFPVAYFPTTDAFQRDLIPEYIDRAKELRERKRVKQIEAPQEEDIFEDDGVFPGRPSRPGIGFDAEQSYSARNRHKTASRFSSLK